MVIPFCVGTMTYSPTCPKKQPKKENKTRRLAKFCHGKFLGEGNEARQNELMGKLGMHSLLHSGHRGRCDSCTKIIRG